MQNIQATDILEFVTGCRTLRLPDGGLLAGTQRNIRYFASDTASDLLAIMKLIDGSRPVSGICEAMAAKLDRDRVLEVLNQLSPCAVTRRRSASANKTAAAQTDADKRERVKVLLVGNGRMADWLENQLTMLSDVSRLDLTTLAGSNGAAEKSGTFAKSLIKNDAHYASFDLVLAALEGVSYGTIHSLNAACLRAGASFLAVSLENNSVTIGPTVIPGDGPCVMSAIASLTPDRPSNIEAPDLIRFLEAGQTSKMDDSFWSESALLRIAMIVRREIRGLRMDGMTPQLLVSVIRIGSGGELTRHSILGASHCSTCASSISLADLPLSKKEHAAEAHVQARINDLIWLESQHTSQPSTNGTCRSVGVIGGGTAGYLTALALEKAHPELKVTLIESSTVPIIGVGEATTPLMPALLHGLLAFPVHEFFREVQPTFKLGIKFIWGAPNDLFDYPFGDFNLVEAQVYEDKIVDHSLYSQLMAQDRFPLARMENGRYVSFLRPHTAYHLDNVRFVSYLSKKAKERNITHVDALIRNVETCRAADGAEEVAAIHLDDGRRLSFDLYVDCTGFRSLLLGKALKTPFVSYDRSLFTDQAVVSDVPHGGRLKPYTVAETMNSGWCWNIPQVESDHRGYVCSSAFCSIDEAVAEMRQKNPDMGDYWTVKFRSGRHEEFWRGNVIAMGNAYAFVEPLESTALHMVISQIRMVLDALPVRRGERGIQRCLSRRVAEHWDYIRWFLAVHYRFNRRLNTPFWQACRDHADISTMEELLHHYTERGPLSYYRGGHRVFGAQDAIWGPQGVDIILMGQQVPTRVPLPLTDELTWKQRVRAQRGIVSRCMTEESALKVLENDPSILESFADESVYRRKFV